jgi:hypothetical protein
MRFIALPLLVTRALIRDDLFRGHSVKGYTRKLLGISLGMPPSSDGADGPVENQPVRVGDRPPRFLDAFFERLFRRAVDDCGFGVAATRQYQGQGCAKRPHST